MKWIREGLGRRVALGLLLLWGVAAGVADAGAAVQEAPPAKLSLKGTEKPLPDLVTLMHAVQENERAAEATEKNYIYHAVQTLEQNDKRGGVKKREVREYDVFWIEGVPVRKTTRKNGKDLDVNELKKEDDHIEKEVQSAKSKRNRGDSTGKVTDPRGNDVVTVSRLLELGVFTNARRVAVNGRPTIAVDYAGDPKAKTENRMEGVIRDMAGTAWVDEEDRMLVRAEGRFVNDFKIGGGLLANIRNGTNFSFEMRKVNGEVWLPAVVEGRGAARAMLFFSFDGTLRVVNSDYRRFKATSRILPVE